MINKLVVATENQGKLNEFRKLLAPLEVEVLSTKDFPRIGEIVEDGHTFRENALIKARTVALATGLVSLADDSGLEVDALEGQPGVNSARFAGLPKSDAKNNEKLLELLKGVSLTDRTGRFVCAIAMVTPTGEEVVVQGTCAGLILEEQRGIGGFGYDPLFLIPQYNKTFGELDMEVKNIISHRGQATQKALDILQEIFKR